jgi:glutamate-1-semialdehyde 2,1-aminomutase
VATGDPFAVACRRRCSLERKETIEELRDELARRTPKSRELYRRAVEVYPHGEISAARMFDPWPFYATRAEGSRIWDIDGNRYIDCCMCYGVLLLGHRPAPVMRALAAQTGKVPHFGSPHPEEVEWGEKFKSCVPCAERVVLCNTGNEAVQKGVAIARAYTGRNKVAKFEGGFHGSNEYSLWSVIAVEEFMGPPGRPELVPMSPGMDKKCHHNMVLLPFGEESAFELIEEHAKELAVVMIEPVFGPGALTPGAEFLAKLREVTRRVEVPLLFDEVITGFRLGLGGGQEYFDVTPDIGLFGKALGGGTPIGAIGCSREIIDTVMALEPPLLVAGTFSGNAMTLAASNAMLDHLMESSPGFYEELNARGEYLRTGFNDFAGRKGVPATMTGTGSMWQVHMAGPPVETPRDRLREDEEALREYELRLRLEGIFIAADLHLAFISPAHTEADVEEVLRALTAALEETFRGR